MSLISEPVDITITTPSGINGRAHLAPGDTWENVLFQARELIHELSTTQ